MTTQASLYEKFINDPSWSSKIDRAGQASLESRWFSDPERRIFLARLCVLSVPGKFFAETLLIYPCTEADYPIFGSEFIQTRRGYFGATDFHPFSPQSDLSGSVFASEPDRVVEKSAHYDLDTYFSSKLWHKKSETDFRSEYNDVCGRRLNMYLADLSARPVCSTCDGVKFSDFDAYMAENDPAHGILRSYYGPDFARDYIEKYLFPHNLVRNVL